jgi:hypothetical protein
MSTMAKVAQVLRGRQRSSAALPIGEVERNLLFLDIYPMSALCSEFN